MKLRTKSERYAWVHFFTSWQTRTLDDASAAHFADEALLHYRARNPVKEKKRAEYLVSPASLNEAVVSTILKGIRVPHGCTPASLPVISLVLQGKFIDAIKTYRAEAGCGLSEAKSYLEAASERARRQGLMP